VETFRLLQAAKGRIYWFRAMRFTVIFMILAPFVFAEDQTREKDENQLDEEIRIVADKLITNNAEKYAEFTGDVRASQGKFTITSEHLRIYYKDNLDNLKNQTGSQELIKRIVASGHVKISSDQYVAEAGQAEYDLDSTVLVLKGENSTIKSGKNFITGSKITVYREVGQIIVESSAEKRVKAMFYSKQKISAELPEAE
jgi:lipopolysaccharide transport protein LptA